jgi:uncharacterized membrane protein
MHRNLKVLFAPLFLGLFAGSAAYADLTFCNRTDQAAGVALAFKIKNMWTSNGWWTIKPGQCKAIIFGNLEEGPYYFHAQHYSVGGKWSGKHEFCTDRGSFTIKGRLDCEDRGYVAEGFQTIETQGQRDWQHDLLPTSAARYPDSIPDPIPDASAPPSEMP